MSSLAKLMSLPLIFIMLISVVALGANGEAQGACGPAYTTKAGDTLATIALTCGVSYASLVAANPQVANPDQILPGQIITIPGAIIPITGSNPAGLRSLNIVPQAGPAGTLVEVSGSGFPASTTLTVGAGIVNSGPVVSQPITTDANGSFTGQLSIPTDASSLQDWAIFASQSSGNELITVQVPFQVLQIPTPNAVIPITGRRIYIVLYGDTLKGIAASNGTTVSALLKANPDITNPDLIYPGQLIILP